MSTACCLRWVRLNRGGVIRGPPRQTGQQRISNPIVYYSSSRPINNTSESSNCEISSSRSNRSFALFDSLSQSLQNVPTSISSDNASGIYDSNRTKALAWYTCGPTTYAPAHMGHARTYVCLDIMRRVLEYRYSAEETQSNKNSESKDDGCLPPQPPIFVLNITDVDDKILAAADAAVAESEGFPPQRSETALELARRYEAEFWSDLDSLNCLRPHVVTRVTEHVESDIVPYIQRLVDQGMAYQLNDGVYFHVRAYNECLRGITKYGKLAPPAASDDILFETSRSGGNGSGMGEATMAENSDHEISKSQQHKKDPRDFVLWKCKKPGESLWWPSPWGDGRPGWHIECSAMIEAVQRQFRDTHRFHVHAGGIDLKFPHHTNEIAQAEAFGQTSEWIPHWVHTGHLHIDGLKMSKSLKNFVTIQEFLSSSTTDQGHESSRLECPADDFRLWCLGLSGSYRGPATFSEERIAEARTIRQKLVRFLIDGEDWIEKCRDYEFSLGSKKWGDEDYEFLESAHRSQQRAEAALSDDLDGKTFLAELIRIAEHGNSHLTRRTSLPPSPGPIEPLRAVVDIMRRMLSLVGFSDKTARVGMRAYNGSYSSVGNVVGGEVALANVLARFRSTVRQLALEDARNKCASENMNEILTLCDALRDDVLPEMGIEVSDGRSERGEQQEVSKWRFCFPRSSNGDSNEASEAIESDSAGAGSATKATDLSSIPLEELFRVGSYEGVFSEFTSDGIPTKNADGSEVSKRLLKKLLKKRDAHQKRLEAASATSD